MKLAPETLGVIHLGRMSLVVVALLIGFAELVHVPVGDQELYTTSTLEARVHQAQTVRGHGTAPIDIEVRNTSSVPCDLVVALSAEYLDSFEHVAMIPAPAEGTDRSEEWAVRFDDVAPGDQRLVALEVQAGEPGPHAGEVRIQAAAGNILAIPIRTFVAP